MKNMKHIYWLLIILGCMVWFPSGCGKKGAPIVPVIPQPLAAQEFSARVTEDGIVLSWVPPVEYDSNKALDLTDIKTFTIFRKMEAPAKNHWDFSKTTQGWTAAGKTFPIRFHRGLLRAASEQNHLLILSQKDLAIAADDARYIRLKLWTNSSEQGFITFITEQNSSWDIDTEQRFEPAVHTSFYAYQQAFHSLKLQPFRIHPTSAYSIQEYLIDMRTVAAWKGTIKQVGVLLKNSDPGYSTVEIGLDSLEFSKTPEKKSSIYEAPPWIFLEDQEGWTSSQAQLRNKGPLLPGLNRQIRPLFRWICQSNVSNFWGSSFLCDPPIGRRFGTAGGVLYAQGTDAIRLMSAPGQAIPLNTEAQLRIRMKVTAGNEAYVVFRTNTDDSWPTFDAIAAGDEDDEDSVKKVSLNTHESFFTYTIDLPVQVPSPPSEALPEAKPVQSDVPPGTGLSEPAQSDVLPGTGTSQQVSTVTLLDQIGLVFPALDRNIRRHILIDCIELVVPDESSSQICHSSQVQTTLPSLTVLDQQIRQNMRDTEPEIEIPYLELPDNSEKLLVQEITLAGISPKNPAPAEMENEQFVFVDTGQLLMEDAEELLEDDARQATLDYGMRYTYQLELTDRKGRKSPRSTPLTVEFTRIPTDPVNFKAVPGDRRITLTWDRPILTQDGQKIKSLAGYHIFRSLTPGVYAPPPIAQIPAQTIRFTDTSLTNGIKYYYTIRSIMPNAGSAFVRGDGAFDDKNYLEVKEISYLFSAMQKYMRYAFLADILKVKRIFYLFSVMLKHVGYVIAANTLYDGDVSAIPVDNSPPDSPTGVVGVYLQDGIHLYWNQLQSPDFAGFNVYRSQTSDGEFTRMNTQPILNASYQDPHVEVNARYYYQVTTLDNASPPNESPASEIAVVETFTVE